MEGFKLMRKFITMILLLVLMVGCGTKADLSIALVNDLSDEAKTVINDLSGDFDLYEINYHDEAQALKLELYHLVDGNWDLIGKVDKRLSHETNTVTYAFEVLDGNFIISDLNGDSYIFELADFDFDKAQTTRKDRISDKVDLALNEERVIIAKYAGVNDMAIMPTDAGFKLYQDYSYAYVLTITIN